MKENILNFLRQYLVGINEQIKHNGKVGTICLGLNLLINEECFDKDELRKELSIFTKRIISIYEFDRLLMYDGIMAIPLLNEE